MIRTIRRYFFSAALAASLMSWSSAHGQIHENIAGGSPRTDGGKVVGISLNSYGNTITSLGFYDHGQDGISDSYQLGLWDSAQNLVRTATVTPSSPLTGDFRYASIAPITLGTFANPETFTIGVLLPANLQDMWLDDALLVLYSGYTGAGTGQYSGPSGTLVYPATFDDSPYYVVNANGPAPPLVPEPATAGLAAVALAGSLLAMPRRARRRSTTAN